MSDYQEHMQMIHSMEGWNYPETAPMNKSVTVMDHAGNQYQAIREIGGWKMKSISSIMDGQRVTPRKWKP